MSCLHRCLAFGAIILGFALPSGTAQAQQARNPLTRAAALRTYDLHFDNAPWRAVVKWLVEVTELPYLGGSQAGAFTFTPPRVDDKDTVPQIIDILNEALEARKLVLIRRQASLVIWPTEMPIDEAA